MKLIGGAGLVIVVMFALTGVAASPALPNSFATKRMKQSGVNMNTRIALAGSKATT